MLRPRDNSLHDPAEVASKGDTNLILVTGSNPALPAAGGPKPWGPGLGVVGKADKATASTAPLPWGHGARSEAAGGLPPKSAALESDELRPLQGSSRKKGKPLLLFSSGQRRY